MKTEFNLKSFVSDIAQVGAQVIKEREKEHWYPCGNAWVKMGARGKIAKMLIDSGIASKSYQGGVRIYCASIAGYHGQSMETSKAICKASLSVFEKHGLKVDYIDSWID